MVIVEKDGHYISINPTEEERLALEDYNLELKFAKEFLNGTKQFDQFPYYQGYVDTLNAEAPYLKNASKILFIGSGAMPISAILLKQKYPYKTIDLLDMSYDALYIGGRVADRMHVEFGLIPGNAETYHRLAGYNAIVLALEAGATSESKRKILDNIYSQIKPGTIVLLRGDKNTGGGAYVKTRNLLPAGIKIEASVSTFDGYGETLVTEKD